MAQREQHMGNGSEGCAALVDFLNLGLSYLAYENYRNIKYFNYFIK